jgi:hypothetical protein
LGYKLLSVSFAWAPPSHIIIITIMADATHTLEEHGWRQVHIPLVNAGGIIKDDALPSNESANVLDVSQRLEHLREKVLYFIRDYLFNMVLFSIRMAWLAK